MKRWVQCVLIILALSPACARSQSKMIIEAPREKQLLLLWRYCTENYISDRDSLVTNRFLNEVIRGADSSGNHQLKAYAQYFRQCWRVLFSERYARSFVPENQTAINTLYNAQSWALKNNYPDIAASCEHSIGVVYSKANRHGSAFEHLLKADNDFKKIGYQHVPNASHYLYTLGICFYRFEEYDKTLQYLLQGTRYAYYMLPREEINTFNTIGLIYARRNEPEKAITFFRTTTAKAKQYGETVWIGIASGNLANVLQRKQQYDSALFYHRINYVINGSRSSEAPEDAAKTALSIATIYLHKGEADSALYYIRSGKDLVVHKLKDSTERLEFNKQLLQVRIGYSKAKRDLQTALQLTDSLHLVEQNLRSKLDSKILSRAVEKTEAVTYQSNLALLKSEQNLAQLRLYISIAIFFLVLIIILFIFRDKWLRKKRQIQIAELDKQVLLTQKLRAEDISNHSKELLKAYVDMIKEKTTLIENLESELNNLKKLVLSASELETVTSNRERLMMSTILTDKDWQQFRILFERVYPGFSYRLKETYPELTPAEARFLFLTKLDLSAREMATMLGISVDAIHKLRYRLRKKLNIEEDSSFKAIIRKIDEPVQEPMSRT